MMFIASFFFCVLVNMLTEGPTCAIKELINFWLHSKPFINSKSCAGGGTDEFPLYLQMPDRSRMEMTEFFLGMKLHRIICSSLYQESLALPYWPFSSSDFWSYVEYFRTLGDYNRINELAKTFFAQFPLGATLAIMCPTTSTNCFAQFS